MTQADKARRFAALHVKGDPVVLYNREAGASSFFVPGLIDEAGIADSVARRRCRST